jgi:transposase
MENPREQKGLEIADRYRITQQDGTWIVPSQNGKGKYKVDPEKGCCSCPDYEFTQSKCKHQFAVEFTIERTRTTTIEGDKTTVTETVKVTRKTYPQEWSSYNKAQTQEKEQFLRLLRELCKGVGEPAQTNGRPRLPLEDMIFAATFKVYSTVSARRFMSDLRDAFSKGFISKLPCYNSIFNYLESEVMTDYLKMLIEESSLPLTAIEENFAVDSSGFSTCRFVQWMHAKYSNPHLIDKKDWIKVHIMCGVTTNVVTSVEISERHSHDTKYFKPLVAATGQNFAMSQVSADRAYSSESNLAAVLDHKAMPFIPFKSDATGKGNRSGKVWKQMYHYFAYNQETFMRNYHRRSNVETTFHMIKSKFGDALRSKTKRAQVNEALCKILCHNICCLIQAMFELNVKPEFWQEVAA